MDRITTFLRHNGIALLALFLAMGGTGYAAVAIPRDSVGARQLRDGAVTPAKLAGNSFGGRILDYAVISQTGAVEVSDPRGIKTQGWSATGGVVIFPGRLGKGCFPMAGSASPLAPNSQGAPPTVSAGLDSDRSVTVRVSGPVLSTLTVVCPAR